MCSDVPLFLEAFQFKEYCFYQQLYITHLGSQNKVGMRLSIWKLLDNYSDKLMEPAVSYIQHVDIT